MEYVSPDARTTDNPVVNTGGTLIWATWEPLHMRASSQDGGDTPAARMWAGQSRIQFPAIDDAFAQITVQDDDFITDDQGFRFNIENPVLSSDGAFWTAIVDKIR